MKKVLLTGSSSYTGSKFIDLYGDAHNIVSISRSDPSNPIDLNDSKAIEELFEAFQPDVVVHLAATLGRDAGDADVLKVDVTTTKQLIDLAVMSNIPFVFTSSEIIYNGRADGMYKETDEYRPRTEYGESKVISEKYLIESGLPYLITRGHRYIGFPSARFDRPKQFPDAIRDLMDAKIVHADSKKKVNPILIDDICDVIDHYISNDLDKRIILNVGMSQAITYYELLQDIAAAADLDPELVHDDGFEAGWLDNNTLSTEKQRQLGYPQRSYTEIVENIASQIRQTRATNQ